MSALDTASVTADLTRDEGMRLFVYDDATGKPIRPGSTVIGHPTVGIGRALDTHGITASEAAFLLGDDIPKCDAQLTAALPWYPDLDSVRRRVLLEMAFNLGVTGLLQFRQMLAAVETQDWTRAKANMVASHWFLQVGARGARLANMMLNGA